MREWSRRYRRKVALKTFQKSVIQSEKGAPASRVHHAALAQGIDEPFNHF